MYSHNHNFANSGFCSESIWGSESIHGDVQSLRTVRTNSFFEMVHFFVAKQTMDIKLHRHKICSWKTTNSEKDGFGAREIFLKKCRIFQQSLCLSLSTFTILWAVTENSSRRGICLSCSLTSPLTTNTKSWKAVMSKQWTAWKEQGSQDTSNQCYWSHMVLVAHVDF